MMASRSFLPPDYVRCHPRYQHGQAGVSLLELTIVFVIIGLLYGGILKGQDMIETARLHAVAQQVQTYQMATQLFVERYGALPGDYAAADTLHKTLKNGNGNGKIEGDGLDPEAEAFHFWSHLRGAQLIADVKISGQPTFGEGAPSAKIGGGFTIAHHVDDKRPGLWLVLGQASGKKGNGGLLTPRQAAMLDKKMDTGHPTTGLVQAEKGQDAAGPCVSGEKYVLEDTTPSCVVYFRIW